MNKIDVDQICKDECDFKITIECISRGKLSKFNNIGNIKIGIIAKLIGVLL